MTLRLDPSTKPLLRQGTRFWLVGAEPSLRTSLAEGGGGGRQHRHGAGRRPARAAVRGPDQAAGDRARPAGLDLPPDRRHGGRHPARRLGLLPWPRGGQGHRPRPRGPAAVPHADLRAGALRPLRARRARCSTRPARCSSRCRARHLDPDRAGQRGHRAAGWSSTPPPMSSTSRAAGPATPSSSISTRAAPSPAPKGAQVYYDVLFTDPVGDLDVGSPVRLRGFQIGVVSAALAEVRPRPGRPAHPRDPGIEPDRLMPQAGVAGPTAGDWKPTGRQGGRHA